MNRSDLLKSAVQGLLQHKLRSLLTLMGVALGSLLLFTSLSGGLGVTETVNRRLDVGERLLRINVLSGHIVTPATVEAARSAGFTQEMSDERRIRLATARGIGGRKDVPLTISSLDDLESMDHVASVWPVISFRAPLFIESSSTWAPVNVNAIRPTAPVSNLLVAGRWLAKDAANEILVNELYLYAQGFKSEEEMGNVIGTKVRVVPSNESTVGVAMMAKAMKEFEKLAAEQGLTEDQRREKTNAKIQSALEKANVQPVEFEIVGILRAPTVREIQFNPTMNDFKQNVLMPHQPASEIWRKLNSATRRIQAVVLADEPENVIHVEKDLHAVGYLTNSLAKLAHQVRSAVLLITAIVTAIATAALLIAGIGITNTMVMNVMERRREIAIMKSIGAQDRDIRRIFLLEGMLIGFVGGVLGLILGYALTQLTGDTICRILEQRLNEPFGEQIFAYPLWLIAATPLVAMVVTTIASAIPARQAAKVDPVSTLQAL